MRDLSVAVAYVMLEIKLTGVIILWFLCYPPSVLFFFFFKGEQETFK